MTKKMSLLEEIQIHEDVASNPEGMSAAGVVKVMSAINQLNESTVITESADEVLAWLDTL